MLSNLTHVRSHKFIINEIRTVLEAHEFWKLFVEGGKGYGINLHFLLETEVFSQKNSLFEN